METPAGGTKAQPASEDELAGGELGFRLVGVGASAGGLEALEQFFESAAPDVPAAFLVVQHLSPDHKSLMADILGKRTRLRVAEAESGMVIERGHIYVIPPKANLSIEGGELRLVDRAVAHSINLPIDLLFRALAEQQGQNAVGVVLSGTGSDGRAGVAAIRQAGGLVLVQEPSSARFDGMPLAAISTGHVDHVLEPRQMVEVIARLAHSPRGAAGGLDGSRAQELEVIHALLRQASGIDFSEYKPTTVLRRIERRMGMLGLAGLGDYGRRLAADPVELATLGRELLISVTRFFRDEEVWKTVGQRALKELVLRSPPRETLRLWVAGCATGQEAYTLAILLDEVIRESGKSLDFKIFATDLDREAVDFAARGEYEESAALDLGEERLQRHFVRRGDLWVADRELRRRIVFAPHNIAQDPPFTRLDLVSCRNVLIYLGVTLQKRVLGAFAFGLKPGAYLLLGTSETLGEAADRFRTLDSQAKLFQRTGGPHQLVGEGLGLAMAPPPGASQAGRSTPQSEDQQATETAFRLLMEKFAPTSVLVREDLSLVSVFGNVQRFLTVPLGQASLSLPAMLQENLRLVTQMACTRALASGQEQALAAQDGEGTLPVKVKPFTLPRSGRRYLVVVYGGFEQREKGAVGAVLDTGQALDAHAQELQRELQFVRESLQSTIEELETSSEELQATNEELLASNEELQSTNEELQSVNEELGTVNAEHQARIGELLAANADLDNLFRSTSIGILFLDQELRIRRFTPAVAAAFNVLERDEGRPIHHLTSRLQDRDLLPDLERVRDGGPTVEREVELLDGRHFMVRVLPYVGLPSRRGVVVTLIETTQLRAALRGVEQLQQVIDSLREHVAVVDGRGVIRLVNAAWHRFALRNGGDPYRVGPGADYLEASSNEPVIAAGIRAVLAREKPVFEHEYPCHGDGGQRWFLLYCSPLSGQPGAVISHIEITDRRSDVRHTDTPRSVAGD